VPTNEDKRLRQIGEFLHSHARTINNALDVYARNMSEESANALAGYNAICNDPIARGKQDGSFIKTNGLLRISQVLQENADTATAARQALEALEGDE
jgi:hypothetical protein